MRPGYGTSRASWPAIRARTDDLANLDPLGIDDSSLDKSEIGREHRHPGRIDPGGDGALAEDGYTSRCASGR